MKKTAVIIGKSIIRRLFDYYKDVELDDETEFFPILKIIISSIMDTFKNDFQRQNIEKELKEYSKQLYISLWLQHADEDEEEINIEYERRAAIKRLENIYKKT